MQYPQATLKLSSARAEAKGAILRGSVRVRGEGAAPSGE
jgi:hypothetical protein